MCQKCYEVALKHLGYLPREEIPEVLMNATCFPFCGPDVLEKQIIEIKMRTDGTLYGAMAYADKVMSEEHEKAKKEKNSEL